MYLSLYGEKEEEKTIYCLNVDATSPKLGYSCKKCLMLALGVIL